MLFPNWFEIGLEIAKQSLPVVVLLASVVYVWRLERSKRAKHEAGPKVLVQAHFRPEAQ
jgi:hypothetical protein